MKSDPDAIKYKIYGHVVFVAVGLLGGLFSVLRGTFGGQAIDDAGIVAAGITGFAAIGHLLLSFCEPRSLTLAQGLALLLLLLSPFAFLYPVVTRPQQGWPVNPGKGPRVVGSVRSRVISPGDEVSVQWTAEDIIAVDSLWRGNPTVEVLNCDEMACPEDLPATGRDEEWQQWIWSNGSVDEHPPFLTARFPIPDDARLDGKSLKLRITLPITYPAPYGDVEYVEEQKTFVREDEILLAPPTVKKAYWTSWRTGATAGIAGTALGGLLIVGVALGLRQ